MWIEMWIEKAPYQLPYRLAARGQSAGVVGLVVLAGLAALAIYLDHPWVAGIFGVLDFVGVVAAFSQKEQSGSHADKD